ncbi:MAG: 30S ribosomal protein S16 [Patescibacteria group bacterium]
MLTIRLQRVGKTKRPTYRLVVSEKIHDPQYGSLEILGNYNPIVIPAELNLKVDRIKYWISVGAQPSPTVHNLLVGQKIIEGKKRKSVALSDKRRKKIADKKAKSEPAVAPQA